MKNISSYNIFFVKKTFFLLLFSLITFALYSQNKELDSIFAELDKVMANRHIYISKQEQRIAELKNRLNTPGITLEQRFHINQNLHSEYRLFNLDSARLFVYDNIRIAQELNNHRWLISSKFALTRIYSTRGLYIDALNLVTPLRADAYYLGMMPHYYSVKKQLYRFYSSFGTHLHPKYFKYRDSLLMVTDENSSVFPFLIVEKLIDDGQWEEGRELLYYLFAQAEQGSHLQAMLANTLGRAYIIDNNFEMQKKYLAISAIGDIKNAIRANESFTALATALYKTGDIARAHRLILHAMEDAIHTGFNAGKMEISQIFPIIQRAYQYRLRKEKEHFFHLLIVASFASILLVIGLFYIYRQMRRLKIMRKKLIETNEQLSTINNDLSDANLLKGTYITQFLSVCSLYIKKMEKYRSDLNRKAMNRQLEEISLILKSKDFIDRELKELYELFDSVFFKLYPCFVEDVNSLLPESEKFKVKESGNLSAGLRILALIRLGITDSESIAEFLHCSVKTVYNYRTRFRKIAGEEFEERIKRGSPVNSEFLINESPCRTF